MCLIHIKGKGIYRDLSDFESFQSEKLYQLNKHEFNVIYQVCK